MYAPDRKFKKSNFILINVLDCKLYFIVVLICVSLTMSEAERLGKRVAFKMFTYFS